MAKAVATWRFPLALVGAASCWGLGAVMSKAVLTYLPPLTLLLLQLVASLAFLWSLVVIQGLAVPLRRSTLWWALTGVLSPGLTYTLTLLSLTLTTASTAALIWAIQPVLILGLARLVLREPVTRPLLACSAVAVIGVVLVALDIGAENHASLVGNGLALASSVCVALYVVLTRRALTVLHPLVVVALQQTAACFWAAGLWLVVGGYGVGSGLPVLSPEQWGWAIASGLVYYALAFWWNSIGLQHTPASVASVFLNMVPLVTVGGSYLFLGERLAPLQWVGAALILGAVLGLLWSKSPAVRTVSEQYDV